LCELGSVVATSAEVCEGVDGGQPVVGDVVVEQLVISGVDSAEVGSSPKFQLLPHFHILGPSSASNKELETVSCGIKAPVKLDSLFGSFGWHPRRTISKHKTPCWKNLSKIK
jgi:hypothetical protein